MSTSNRLLVIAFAWLILANVSPPGDSGKKQQSHTDTAVEQSLNEIASALQNLNKPDSATKPCKKDEENRNSDLCAQWKAADAAWTSAVWTERTFWLGLVGLVIGGLTLAAAASAAKWAKKAAEHTERSNAIAVELQRPWIAITCTPKSMTLNNEIISVGAVIEFSNIGNIPAIECNLRGVTVIVAVYDGSNSLKSIQEWWQEFTKKVPSENEVLLPQEKNIRSTVSEFSTNEKHIGSRDYQIFAVISAHYAWAQGDKIVTSMTERSYLIQPIYRPPSGTEFPNMGGYVPFALESENLEAVALFQGRTT